MFWDSLLGFRRRLAEDELERVDVGGFGERSELSWMLLGRCDNMLLRPSTAREPLLFFGGEGVDCGEG